MTFTGGGKIKVHCFKRRKLFMANKYVGEFYVNNMRTREEVVAGDSTQAKKLIEAKYPNCKIRWAVFPKLVK